MQYQQTIEKEIEIMGIEPFGGKQVKVTINPAPADTGRIFRTSGIDIPATLKYVEPIKGITKLLSLKKDNRRILIPEHLIGEFSLLPGRLAGVKITSRFAGHKDTIETLKKNLNKFYVKK